MTKAIYSVAQDPSEKTIAQSVRRWTVSEFKGLVRHRLLDLEGPVELVEGRVQEVPLARQLAYPVQQLASQIEQIFSQCGLAERYQVQPFAPIQIDNDSLLLPALSIVDCQADAQQACWVLDVVVEGEVTSKSRASCQLPAMDRQRVWARAQIAEYWSLNVDRVELRKYWQVSPETPQHAYQQQQLLSVHAQTAPNAFSQLMFRLQEPLPLYFLTRTSHSQKTYAATVLPLRLLNVRVFATADLKHTMDNADRGN